VRRPAASPSCSRIRAPQDGNWTHEKALVKGPRVTLANVEKQLREQCAARPDATPPPSVVLLAQLPDRNSDDQDAFIGCIEVTTTDACASVAAPGGAALDGYLGMLAVDPAHGSRGVGRALVAAGEALSRDLYGCEAVVLYVLSVRDDILEWYARSGYERTGLRVEARNLIESIQADASLLVDADFIVLRRVLP